MKGERRGKDTGMENRKKNSFRGNRNHRGSTRKPDKKVCMLRDVRRYSNHLTKEGAIKNKPKQEA